jgi:hypothetical protein
LAQHRKVSFQRSRRDLESLLQLLSVEALCLGECVEDGLAAASDLTLAQSARRASCPATYTAMLAGWR